MTTICILMSSTHLSSNTMQQKTIHIWNSLTWLLPPHPVPVTNYNPQQQKKRNKLYLVGSSWIWHAKWISVGIIITCLSWMAHRLASSRRAHQVIFGRFLQCLDSVHLEAQVVCPLFLCYLLHQAHAKGHLQIRSSMLFWDQLYLVENHHPQPGTSRASSAHSLRTPCRGAS